MDINLERDVAIKIHDFGVRRLIGVEVGVELHAVRPGSERAQHLAPSPSTLDSKAQVGRWPTIPT